MSDINLGSATRANLLSLQSTQSLIDRTQNRLATGLKVNSPLDDALAFFKARNLNDRASDLSTIKDGISGAISVITAATQGLKINVAALAAKAGFQLDQLQRQVVREALAVLGEAFGHPARHAFTDGDQACAHVPLL